MDSWKGRIALVTGASAGIGSAICKGLVKHGMTVIGCAREVQKIQEVSDKGAPQDTGNLHAIKCDLSQEEEIVSMFEEIRKKFGHIDVCINNAGFATNSPLLSGFASEWRDMLEVNIVALCICTREAVKLMKEANINDGLIIHMGSVFGHKVPVIPNNVHAPAFGLLYGVKFMIRGLADALRQELKSTNSKIRVATISPGAVETEFLARSFNPEAAQHFYGSVQCLQPQDIAEAVLYILKTPPYVNVQDIIVQPIDFYI